MKPGIIFTGILAILIAAFLIWAKYEAKKINQNLSKKSIREQRRKKKYGF